jgi:hypothetical protein
MRDRRATAYRDSAEIINKSMLANGTFIARFKVPGEINRRRRINVNATTKLCSETAKQKSPPAETRLRTEPEKRLSDPPHYPDESFRPMDISWRDDFVQCPACL